MSDGVAAYVFFYRNHRGEESLRRVVPISIRFGASQWHPQDQWLMKAFDLEKREDREFAMKDILRVEGYSQLGLCP